MQVEFEKEKKIVKSMSFYQEHYDKISKIAKEKKITKSKVVGVILEQYFKESK